MSLVTPDTPLSGIVIQGLPFQAPEPYSAGHELVANEADALNQTFQENLRNNFSSTVKEEVELAALEGREVDKAKLDKLFQAYYMEYQFGVRRSGARGLDPLQAAIRDIGRDLVRKALRRQGVKVADVTTREIDELVDQAVSKPENAWIIDLARKRVEDDAKLAGLSITV